MKRTWKRVSFDHTSEAHNGLVTERLEVSGGWLYRTFFEKERQPPSLVFVPKPAEPR